MHFGDQPASVETFSREVDDLKMYFHTQDGVVSVGRQKSHIPTAARRSAWWASSHRVRHAPHHHAPLPTCPRRTGGGDVRYRGQSSSR